MRTKPTLRIPFGILALLFGLAIYALGVAWASQWIGQWHILVQTLVYIVLGVAWLLPLRGSRTAWLRSTESPRLWKTV